MNIRHHTTLRNSHRSQQLVQFFVIANTQLDMSGNNTSSFMVTGSITGKLQDLSGKVLEHSTKIDGSTGTHTLGIAAFL